MVEALSIEFLSAALLGDFAQHIYSLWDLHNRETANFLLLWGIVVVKLYGVQRALDVFLLPNHV